MNSQMFAAKDTTSGDESEVRTLYSQLLEHWNKREPYEFGKLFANDGSLIGFDGSPLNGRAEIELHIRQVFADHSTAAYVGKVRDVRFLTPDVALLRAVAGMVSPGQTDLNPAVNTIQSLVAVRQADNKWLIAQYQNTPAQFHGRPEMVEQLTEELRQLL